MRIPSSGDLRAVVLAAGDGGRLGELTSSTPKPLVAIDGRPLIDFTLEGLATAGVRDAAIVTGYRADQLVAGLGEAPREGIRLHYIHNDRFDGGASLSLRAAREFAGDDPFILVMADHLLSGGLLTRLVAEADDFTSYVAADFDSASRVAAYVDDSTKVAVDDTRAVTSIGKSLPAWDALDTGAFLLAPDVWDAVDAAPEDCELSAIFGDLARRRLLRAADVSGEFWYDIDTVADLAHAVERLPGAASGV